MRMDWTLVFGVASCLVVIGGCAEDSESASDDGTQTELDETEEPSDTESGPCVVASVQDDFSSASLDMDTWLLVDSNGIEVEISEERLSFPPVSGWAEGYWATVRPTSNVDRGDCSSWVEAVRVLPSEPLGEVIYEAQIDADRYAMIRVGQPDLQFVLSSPSGGVLTEGLPYDTNEHRWWRYRDEGGVFYLETSPDRSAWTVGLEHDHGGGWDLSSVRLSLKVSAADSTEGFPAPQFDNFNVAP